MSDDKRKATTEELYQLLKKTSLPTVLVEGKNDIIFYRTVEEELQDLGIDMLPAGNKDAVLELRQRLKAEPISIPIAFIVDKDLWVHGGNPRQSEMEDVITTDGYSIENDLFIDGDLTQLLYLAEKDDFAADVDKFVKWYSLAVHRNLVSGTSGFRTHPGKILDDPDHYATCMVLSAGELYPDVLMKEISASYSRLLRGKSLFALLHRQLSRRGRATKFSEKQLMEIGSARRGACFTRITGLVRDRMTQRPDMAATG